MSAIIKKQNTNKQVYKELAKNLKNYLPKDKAKAKGTTNISAKS